MSSVPSQEATASRLALVACRLAVVVRIVLVVGVVTLPIAFLSSTAWNWIHEIVLALFVVLMGAYIGLAFTLRCPNCRRRFLVERRDRHAAAKKAEHLGHWGTVVRDVLRQRHFTCMYCGVLSRVHR